VKDYEQKGQQHVWQIEPEAVYLSWVYHQVQLWQFQPRLWIPVNIGDTQLPTSKLPNAYCQFS
jgi:hypothetical protein